MREKNKKVEKKLPEEFLQFSSFEDKFQCPIQTAPLKQQCGAKWICNLFKQLSLPFWEYILSPSLPLPAANVTVKCTNAASCSQYKQMLPPAKFVIMQ